MMTSGELAIRHFCRDGRGLVRAERGHDPAARPTPGRRSPPRGRVRAPAGRPAPPRGGLQQPEHPPGLTPGRSAASTSSSPARRSRKGYRQHSCGNTLQGLSASPRVAPEPAAGRGRPAASGNRRGSVRNKRTFWLNSLAPRNMTGSVVRICQEIPRSRIPWTGRSTVQQDVRSATLISERTREAPWATVDRSSARGAPGRALVVELGAPTVRATRAPSGGRLGPVRAAVRRRARRPAPPEPLAVYFCTNLVGTLRRRSSTTGRPTR